MIEVQDKPLNRLSDEEVLYILDVQLPEMLERNPGLEPRAFRAFLKAFTTKEETAAVLAELREFHGEFRHFRTEVENRFEQVDQRFDQVDQHFEQVDQRFEQVDQRFEQVDQRFEQVDQRFDQVDQRFDQVDQRFDQVDQRFEQVDQRFEQVDQRFEQMDQHFKQVDGHLVTLDQRFDRLEQKVDDLRDWVELVVGRFQVRSGRKLEDVVAGTLRLALKRPGLNPDRIRLRQKIVDQIGVTGPVGRKFAVDILADDGEITVFEIKSVCEPEDVDRLADKLTLMRALHPDQKVTGVMIALGVEDETKARCAQYGIALVH